MDATAYKASSTHLTEEEIAADVAETYAMEEGQTMN
jgi:hypothetical protein